MEETDAEMQHEFMTQAEMEAGESNFCSAYQKDLHAWWLCDKKR